jgi:hypothetical protein
VADVGIGERGRTITVTSTCARAATVPARRAPGSGFRSLPESFLLPLVAVVLVVLGPILLGLVLLGLVVLFEAVSFEAVLPGAVLFGAVLLPPGVE